jgi:hypothetical protein
MTIWVHVKDDNAWHIARATFPDQADVLCTSKRLEVKEFISSTHTKFWDLEGGTLCQACIANEKALPKS